MTFSGRTLLMLGCATTLFAVTTGGPTVFYNNLNADIGNWYFVDSIEGDGPLYNSFSTGSTGLVLNDVKVYLDLDDEVSGNFTAGLYANTSSNKPGALIKTLGTFNDRATPADGDVFDVPVNPGISLNANTRYWIGMTSTDGSSTQWASTDETSGTGNISSEYNCRTAFEGETGASAHPRGQKRHGGRSSFQCFSNAVDPFLMEVTANPPAAVPDLSLTGMALLSLLLAASAVVLLRRVRPAQS